MAKAKSKPKARAKAGTKRQAKTRVQSAPKPSAAASQASGAVAGYHSTAAGHRTTATHHHVQVAYISNPLGLVRPSVQALRLNWVTALVTLVVSALTAVGLLVAVVSTVIIALYSHNVRAVALAGLVALALVALAVAIVIPAALIVLLESAKGNRVSVRQAVGRCRHYSGRIFLAGLLTTLATAGGLVLLIIPGLVFGTWFSLSLYVIVDEDVSTFEALRRSRELVRGHLVEMWGLYGLNDFLSLVPIIGSLASIVLTLTTLAAPAVRYLQLKELAEAADDAKGNNESQANVAKPPIHWLNWVVVVLAAISFVVGGYQSTQSFNRATSGPAQPNSPAGINTGY